MAVNLLISGCDKQPAVPPIPYAPAVEPEESSPNTASAVLDNSSELTFEGIRFTLPKGWKTVPIPPEKQGFIDGQLLVPAGGEELILTLSSIGGGIDANIARWKGQFDTASNGHAVVEPLDIAGTTATWVDLQGVFRSAVGRQGGPQTGWRMLGVGIPVKPRDFYLKLIGPADAVEEVRDEFREFVKQARILN